MALHFPSNPSIGATYQSGSSAEYTFNGSVWNITTPVAWDYDATTASYAAFVDSSTNQTASLAAQAEYTRFTNKLVTTTSVTSASLALTASYAPGVLHQPFILSTKPVISGFINFIPATGSLTIPNHAVNYSSSVVSFNSTTGVATIQEQGVYELRGSLTVDFGAFSPPQPGFGLSIDSGSTSLVNGFARSVQKPIEVSTIKNLRPGDQISLSVYNPYASTRNIGSGTNYSLTIHQLTKQV